MKTKITTFEILTLAGTWKPIFCASLNSTDKETGCSVVACHTATPYKSLSPEKDLAYFASKAGQERVRIAQ